MQIGAPIRILALVGVLAALAMGAWTFTAGRSGAGSPSAAQPDPVSQHPVEAAQAVAAKLKARNKAAAALNARSAKTTAAATLAHKVRPKTSRLADGTPRTIASVLRRHRVAVVLLYDPQAKVDAFSLGEAQRGARRAKAGFLRVNVLKQRQAAPFASAYGVLQSPTVLFFARPGKLVQKLVGFADQDTVSQAALNAARGLVVTQG